MNSFSVNEAKEFVLGCHTVDDEHLHTHLQKQLKMYEEEFEKAESAENIYTQLKRYIWIVSKGIQHECRTTDNAWRGYLFGRFDAEQDALLIKWEEHFNKSAIGKLLSQDNAGIIMQFLYKYGLTNQSALAKELGLDQSDLSQMLDQMIGCGLVLRKKNTKFDLYSLSQDGYCCCNRSFCVDSEVDGFLFRPKCRPGDIVYEVNAQRNLISEYEVTCIKYGMGKRLHYLWSLRDGIYSERDGFYDKDYGVNVFMSRREAENVLKGMSKEN